MQTTATKTAPSNTLETPTETPNPLAIACRSCNAPASEYCTDYNGYREQVRAPWLHPVRMADILGVPYGFGKPTPAPLRTVAHETASADDGPTCPLWCAGEHPAQFTTSADDYINATPAELAELDPYVFHRSIDTDAIMVTVTETVTGYQTLSIEAAYYATFALPGARGDALAFAPIDLAKMEAIVDAIEKLNSLLEAVAA